MKSTSRVLFLSCCIVLSFIVFRRYSSNVPVFYLPWQKGLGEAVEPIPLADISQKAVVHSEVPKDPQLRLIDLPAGFSISYFAEDVPNARSMTMNEEGIVFVGSRSQGTVYALVDSDKDHQADEVIVVVEGLNNPNGVAYKDGHLYVVEINKVSVLRDIDTTFRNKPIPEVVFSDFPTDGYHGWKYAAFGPDGLLYIPVGVACNVCDSPEPYGTITRLDVANPKKGYEVVASGVRNTVGFDWHPITDELWFTDNGRDLLGDNIPPDEVNRVAEEKLHFGFPFCHGINILDPKFGKEGDCSVYQRPEVELGPHVAALGMKFYTGAQFPEEYQNKVFIAEHGSWNRSEKIGYRITSIDVTDTSADTYAIFAEGWLQRDEAWGRPVDVMEYIDGSLLISDDLKGAVYRITYGQ